MEISTKAIHKQSYRLHSYEVDLRGVARPSMLLCFMLDSAWSHTKDTEFSYTELDYEGQFWVLSRFLAMFHDVPKWNDEIVVETWGKGTDNLFGLRDFIIYSQDRKKLVSATSAWLIIDRKTQRVQRISSLGKNFPLQLHRDELDVKLRKIEMPNSKSKDFSRKNLIGEFTVRYSDLDVNKHVNSSKYLEWILDSFPAAFHETKSLKSFEINFLSEGGIGDLVRVSFVQVDDSRVHDDIFYCDVRRTSDAVELCRAKLIWNSVNHEQ